MVNEIELKIIETARAIFIEEGYSGARMQKIADVAEINKALLHYYFRSKEKLYEEVVKNLIADVASRLTLIFESDGTSSQKIELVVNMYFKMISRHPKLPLFIMNEIHENPDRFMIAVDQQSTKIQKIRMILSVDASKGDYDGIHSLINLVGMSVFPFLAKPLLKKLFFGGEDESFNQFMESRPQKISQILDI
ncbi:TetR/AcrR family transcriptional regulator [Halosquirtibacter laminarini]|uniref:TetR/AcrR family transcriptional regulator n=1 Tax=Halosquirtibacter laminarini TaxID=3374600 RepID=A0AC61NIP5_9BACT|nr:TetR/AcrR family transcriptional regulator [Prolixibacteraceae bacterium]